MCCKLMLLLALLAVGVTTRVRAASTLRYAVSSAWNQTGHRVVTMEIESDRPASSSSAYNTEPVTVNMAHGVGIRDGVETLRVVASTVVLDSGHASYPAVTRTVGDGHSLDYELFRGVGYYKLHTAPAMWEQARRICESERAHLMVIDSDAELNVLRQFWMRGPSFPGASWGGVHLYLGFDDHQQEGSYVTLTGKPLYLSQVVRWLPGAPHNEKGGNYNTDSDCGCVDMRSVQLDDAPCAGVLGFVCEQEL